jgi:hypothetical protein
MPTLAELKASSPAYAQMSDMEFASKIYRKHYASRMSFPEFAGKVGFDPYGDAKGIDPTEGMTGLEKFRAGMGKSFVDTGRGLVQLGTTGARLIAEHTPDALGGQRAAEFYSGLERNQRQAEAERRRRDQPLRKSGAAVAGEVTGVLSQLLVPGIGLRGTAAGASLLPRTVLGNATQGAALGAAQPVVDDSERIQNTVMNAGFGAAGAAAPKIAGAVYRPAAGYLSRLFQGGSRQRAAQMIKAEAANPTALMRPTPSAIPGVQRTLAEETLDPGLARLERFARSTGQGFDTLDRNNNLARVSVLQQIAGSPEARAAAEAERHATSEPFRRAAMKATGVDTEILRNQLARAQEMYSGRPAVQQTLKYVEEQLYRPATAAEKKAGFPPMVPRDEVQGLYNVRKTLGDLMGGKLAGDQPAAQAATRELMMVRNGLDRAIGKTSPEFRGFLQAYREGSQPINRMELGQYLLDKGAGGAVLDPVTGVPTLTPAAFSRQAADLDRAAAQATGFRKAKAADILTPEDTQAIRAIQDDLERRAFAQSAGSGGNSHTFERFALQDRAASQVAGGVPIIGRFADIFNRIADRRVQAQLAYLLQNPERARAVLASLPANDRRTVETALVQINGRIGVLSAPLSEQEPDQGVIR